MEKLGLLIILVGVVVSANNSFSDVLMGWEKMKEKVWKIHGVLNWYKLDEHWCLWTSTDGKTWEKSVTNTWRDYSDRLIRVKDQMLIYSSDEGKTWNELPHWKFQAGENLYYQFGKNWTLWLIKD